MMTRYEVEKPKVFSREVVGKCILLGKMILQVEWKEKNKNIRRYLISYSRHYIASASLCGNF